VLPVGKGGWPVSLFLGLADRQQHLSVEQLSAGSQIFLSLARRSNGRPAINQWRPAARPEQQTEQKSEQQSELQAGQQAGSRLSSGLAKLSRKAAWWTTREADYYYCHYGGVA